MAFLFYSLVFSLFIQGYSSEGRQIQYVAAVFEHQAIFIPYLKPSRQEALRIMMTNINIYREQARLAKSRQAKIIVFPEDGLYGAPYSRNSMYTFLEQIPNASELQPRWNPCRDPLRFMNTEILRNLSCLAKELSIAIVANMGDVQPCTKEDPHCPHDMRYQYNTDVVFDTDGTLLTKYHKQHLFHEHAFNNPATCNHVTFTTSFGVKFGVFTCFDLLFKCPAVDLVTHYDINNVVMPTGWMAGFPILVSVQYQQAWSRAMCVNFIAANNHQPIVSMYGSGIYSCGQAVSYVYDPIASGKRRLLVATLYDKAQSTHDVTVTTDITLKDIIPNKNDITTNDDVIGKYDVTPKHEATNKDGVLTTMRAKHEFKSITNNINHHLQQFKCKIMNDVYDVLQVKESKGSLSVCQKKLCCHAEYELFGGILMDTYVLGVFRGLHNTDNYFMEVCVLFKCANLKSCGQVVEISSSVFSSLKLSGNFSSTARVFPGVLVSGMKLVDKDGIQVSGHALMSMTSMKEPLISAVLLARDYSKDK